MSYSFLTKFAVVTDCIKEVPVTHRGKGEVESLWGLVVVGTFHCRSVRQTTPPHGGLSSEYISFIRQEAQHSSSHSFTRCLYVCGW